ncbi:MAG: hypothetical protein K6E32_05010 [Lachnospiraceae bacterium]|nr:hypothetical protein [Lachnospiraceae bacterium]
MKKVIFKAITSFLVFIAALFLSGMIMNRGNVNTTGNMPKATLPVIYMSIDGERVNELYGYTSEMDVGLLRENITPLDESRGVTFDVVKYGRDIKNITVKVRTSDGSRLIENIDVKEYAEDDYSIRASVTLKDLIEEYTEYSFQIYLALRGGQTVMYHTKVVEAPSYCGREKLAFVRNFWEKEASTDTNGELKTYMESNYLGDNSSLAYVNIHSSMKQLAFAGLKIERDTPVITVKELASETGIFTVNYTLRLKEESGTKTFFAEEYYRIKYSPEVTYLLDYERTMTEIPDETEMVRKEDILLGIRGDDLNLIESNDGNVLAFVSANKLFAFDIGQNRLARLFSFYDDDNFDSRTCRNSHAIKPLTVDEAGNVNFIVYGYMNRGTYEGRVGIAFYRYNGVTRVTDEVFFIPSDESPEMVQRDIEELSYLSRDDLFYFMLDKNIYTVSPDTGETEVLVSNLGEHKYTISDNSAMMVWQEGDDVNASEKLMLMNLNTRQINEITAPADQYVKPLAFMGEDFVYGLAFRDDVVTDNTGYTTFPMYVLKIQSKYGEILKQYDCGEEGLYVTGAGVKDNLLSIDRVTKTEKGFVTAPKDYISNNQKMEELQNKVNLFSHTKYENIVRILLMKDVKGKTVTLIPKEVIKEGTREVELSGSEAAREYYYVYYNGKLQSIYTDPANAVKEANENYGSVVNGKGYYVWYRANRSLRNQIMNLSVSAVATGEDFNSLAYCLDMMTEYAGSVRNSEYLLSRGKTVSDILKNALEGCDVLNLSGCELDSMLYYVNRDIPVLAITHSGGAYLLIGYNQLAVVVYDPYKGTYKIGRNEAEKLFFENGNQFITYVPNS